MTPPELDAETRAKWAFLSYPHPFSPPTVDVSTAFAKWRKTGGGRRAPPEKRLAFHEFQRAFEAGTAYDGYPTQALHEQIKIELLLPPSDLRAAAVPVSGQTSRVAGRSHGHRVPVPHKGLSSTKNLPGYARSSSKRKARRKSHTHSHVHRKRLVWGSKLPRLLQRMSRGKLYSRASRKK